ncbi:retrovirus-related pol polyprotein from transposon TNT 1-94 [Tanacetum coccineum]
MTTLAEFMIVAGGDSRPPMLDKTMYDSWKSRMELYIEGKENGRMMINSVNNGPLIWPTKVDEHGTSRVKKYEELTDAEKLQADCDLRATNIVLQGLPPDVYSLVNHHRNAAFQTKDLDAYDSDCDDVSSAKAVMMEDLSSYDSDVLSEHVTGKESLSTNLTVFKTESKEKESKYMDKEIALEKKELENTISKVFQSTQTLHMLTKPRVFYDNIHKQALGYQNPFYLNKSQRTKPTLYDGNVITKQHNVVPMIDDEKTLILEEKSRSKMLEKQKDPEFIKKKVKTNPINYVKLNQLSGDFGKLEVPVELPKVSMVNTNIKKIKRHLANFDNVVKVRTTPNAIIEDLNAQLQEKVFAIVALKNKLRKLKDYLKHTQEQANILQRIVEQAKALRSLDNALDFACKYTKHIQDLLVHVRDTCPNITKPSEKLVDVTPLNKNKKVRFADPIISSSNIQEQVTTHKTQDSNKPLLPFTRVIASTSASGSKPTSNRMNNRISRPSSSNLQNKVEEQARKVKSRSNKKNHFSKSVSSTSIEQSMLNANSRLICGTCNENLFDANHDERVLAFVNNVNVRANSKITSAKIVPLKETTIESIPTLNPVIKVYNRRPKATKSVVQIVLWYLDFGCSKHMTGNRSQLLNFVSKFLGTVMFGNDQIAKIMGYSDYEIENVTIFRVYYVKRLGHNLFSVGQFCNSNLEVAFRKHTCFVCNLEGVYLLLGSQETNLYTLSIGDLMKSSLICLLSKASKTKSWLWHRRLSHWNFGTINQLAKQGLVRGLPKLKFEKDHLCSACSLGKSKKHSYKPKSEDTNQEKLYLSHMDLCGSMRVKSINGKKYILVIVDDYSRNIRIDNGTKFVNQTLRSYYEDVGISHETSVARTPQHNGVVERRNHTLVEATRTMLIFAKAPLFLWAEIVATTCYTQNHSLICLHHDKPYELLHNKKPDLSYLHVFGVLCYPTNDNEDLGKLKAKADIGIFIEYAPAKKAYQIYNRHTRRIMETIHVDFDELAAMASKQSSSGPALHEMTHGSISSGLVPQPPSTTPYVPPTLDD